jgi:hypothetical protein
MYTFLLGSTIPGSPTIKIEGGKGRFLHGVTNLRLTIIDREGPIHVEH